MEMILYAPRLPDAATAIANKRLVQADAVARRARLEGQGSAGESGGQRQRGLNPEEQAEVRRLQARDAEVRAHEQAHLAAAGGYAKSGARYRYQTGPDGRQYAVGGEVSLDVGKESDPRQTLQKAIAVQAAALAPSSPSGTDMRVAAQAAMMATEARAEIAAEERAEITGEENAGMVVGGEQRGASPGAVPDWLARMINSRYGMALVAPRMPGLLLYA